MADAGMSEREVFEAWCEENRPLMPLIRTQERDYIHKFTRLAWSMWQAAAAAEREQCAKLCDELADRFREQEQHDFDPGTESYGARECAAAISNRKEPA